MKSLIHNKIFHKYLVGIIAVLLVLIPLFSFVDTVSAQSEPAKAALDGKKTSEGIALSTRIGQAIGYPILSIASLFTYVGGMVLQVSIEKLVLGMGKSMQESLGIVVSNTWTTIRDICNLAFIFGFIYIGIRTIIDSESAGTKKVLATIIIGALLINFSLFFTKVIIDVSNYLAVEIHNTMLTSPNANISAKFADILGIQTFWNSDSNQLAGMTSAGSFTFFFMAAIFLVIAGFVLAAGGILLIVRYVALIFIMVFSPVLFAATVFPQTAKYANELWSKLFGYAFFAPVYLFLLLISIQLMEGVLGALGIGGANKSLSAALASQDPSKAFDAFDMVIAFTIGIMFLIFSLKIAQKLSIFGADKALAIGKDLRMRGQSALTNTALYAPRTAARATVGTASRKMLTGFDKWQAKDGKGAFGKGMRKVLQKTNVDRSLRNTLEEGTKVKAGLKYSYADNEKYEDERNKRITADRAAATREEAIEKASKTGAAPTPDQMKKMVDAIKGLTTDQMKDMDINILTREEVAVHLSTKQIDELGKTGKYSDQQIQGIKDARKVGVEKIASGPAGAVMVGGQTQREILAQRGSEELAKMPTKIFTESAMAPLLTPDMVESKMKAGVSSAELNDIRTNIDLEISNASMSWTRSGNPGVPPYVKQWENWVNRSTFGARLGLTI